MFCCFVSGTSAWGTTDCLNNRTKSPLFLCFDMIRSHNLDSAFFKGAALTQAFAALRAL
jgi:hypothetical protein